MKSIKEWINFTLGSSHCTADAEIFQEIGF